MKEFRRIKQLVERKLEELERIKKKAERSLKKAPEGSLVLSKSNGVVQYYHKTSKEQKKGVYIEKKNKDLVAALAQKDYDQRLIREVEKQNKQYQRVLKNIPDKKIFEVFETLSEERKKFVSSHILSDESYIEQWLGKGYHGKPGNPETLLYTTERGEKVRSKSEKMIADKLFAMGIPYRYEYPLRMKGFGVVYPDFTLLDVTTKQEIYYEHFGLMDYVDYRQKAFLKMQEYAKNDIVLGKNLLISFETLQVPLDMSMVEKMLKMFF